MTDSRLIIMPIKDREEVTVAQEEEAEVAIMVVIMAEQEAMEVMAVALETKEVSVEAKLTHSPRLEPLMALAIKALARLQGKILALVKLLDRILASATVVAIRALAMREVVEAGEAHEEDMEEAATDQTEVRCHVHS